MGVLLALLPARAQLAIHIPGGMPQGPKVTANQLWEEFNRSLPSGVWISPLEASEYQVVPAKWMRRVFLPALKDEMARMWAAGVPQEDSAGDCSGFALVCRLMLQIAAMDSHARAPAAATVIVKQERPFGGLSATRENHCVAFVLTDEGPWIVEAQSGAYTALSAYPNRSTVLLVSVH
jgi:hypothetical protein